MNNLPPNIHRLLKRQIKNLMDEEFVKNEKFIKFIDAVNIAYANYDSDFKQIERILEISNKESFKALKEVQFALDQSAAVFIIDTKGIIQFANDILCDSLGFKKEEVLDVYYKKIIKYTSVNIVDKLKILKNIKTKNSWKGEIEIETKTKQKIYSNTSIIPIFDNEDNIHKFMFISFDITKQKENENELKKMSLIADYTNNAVIIADADFNIEWVNKSFETIFGYTLDEVKGKQPGVFLIGSMSNKEVLEEAQVAIKNKQHFQFEMLTYTKSGSQLWMRNECQPIFNDKNICVQYFAIQTDITETRRAQEILVQREEKYRSIISNINLGLIEVDLNEEILLANNSFCEMSGYSMEELIGKKPTDLYLKIEASKIVVDQKKEIRKQKISDAYEIEIINKSGQKRYWLISGAPLINDNGEQIGSIGIHLDITDRKEQEKQMLILLNTIQNVNKELNEFAYVVSHDLKAPLRAIGSLATWLQADYSDKIDEEGKETLALLVQRTQRMHNLIEGVLNYSKIGKTKEDSVVINTNDMVLKIIDLLSPPKNIQVIIKNELPNIVFEETKIQQVFQNLIDNAIKFMDKPEGLITIESVNYIKYIEFKISDNGPGIDENYYEKIFQIFQTLAPRDEVESTGIGLSVVKKIIESKGGFISVNSKLNEGTTFVFTVKKQ